MRKDFLPEARSCKSPYFFYKPKDQPTNRAAGMVLFAKGLLLIASWMSDRVSLKADLGRDRYKYTLQKNKDLWEFQSSFPFARFFHEHHMLPILTLVQQVARWVSSMSFDRKDNWKPVTCPTSNFEKVASPWVLMGFSASTTERVYEMRTATLGFWDSNPTETVLQSTWWLPYEVRSGQPKSSILSRNLWLLSLHTQSRSFSASPEPRCHLGKSGQGLSGPELLTLASSHLAVGTALTLVAPSWGHVSVPGNPVWEPWFWAVEFFSC